MSLDEPFTLGEEYTAKPISVLVPSIHAEMRYITSLGALVLAQSTIRLVEEPENTELLMGERWPIDRKLTYARARQANAQQLYDARGRFGFKFRFSLATAINLQRLFESCDYEPRRNWRYYPVIDPLLGTGVPRSSTNLPMLKSPNLAIHAPGGKLVVVDGGAQKVHYINHERHYAEP